MRLQVIARESLEKVRPEMNAHRHPTQGIVLEVFTGAIAEVDLRQLAVPVIGVGLGLAFVAVVDARVPQVIEQVLLVEVADV